MLHVRLINESKVRLHEKIFDALREEIHAAVTANSRDHNLKVNVFPDTSPENRFVTVRMQGEDKEKLASLTGTLEAMLSGRVMEVSSDIFDTLAWNKTAARQLEEIQSVNQVYIHNNNKTRKELVFFGPPAKYESVQQAVVDLTAAKGRFAYQLSPDEFDWLLSGGFSEIVSVLDDIAHINNALPSPKSLVINGTAKQYQQARTIMESLGGNLGMNDLTLNSSVQDDDQNCSTCWTPAENPITLACGHVYCAECLTDLCRSSSSDNADFLITCKGANDTCKRVMPLNELQTHLPSQILDEILRLSFDSYIFPSSGYLPLLSHAGLWVHLHEWRWKYHHHNNNKY
ncbi:uncharacterized protein RCC_09990 [Ramularia collo-cygni]|uniref:Zinc finger C3HC4 RING-type domain-containing protein n=1 Tax=Ramularia collo-cygni TaxID=112498 RepID=A0A2D3VIW4_9PEZI|nr:uncharacterized protein RCC_09990 [Ramularia collo-cygni]CZT24271.1 uncharacterized protein RCC_09990 [Ramularia collo-cygni]